MAVEAGFRPSPIVFDQNPRLAPPSLDAPIWSQGRLHIDINPLTETIAWLVAVAQQAEVARGLLEERLDTLAANQGVTFPSAAVPAAAGIHTTAATPPDGQQTSEAAGADQPAGGESSQTDSVQQQSSEQTVAHRQGSKHSVPQHAHAKGEPSGSVSAEAEQPSSEMEERIHLLERKVALLTMGLGPPLSNASDSQRMASKLSAADALVVLEEQPTQKAERRNDDRPQPQSAETVTAASEQVVEIAERIGTTVEDVKLADEDQVVLRSPAHQVAQHRADSTEDLIVWIQNLVIPLIEGRATSVAKDLVDQLRTHVHTLDWKVSELTTQDSPSPKRRTMQNAAQAALPVEAHHAAAPTAVLASAAAAQQEVAGPAAGTREAQALDAQQAELRSTSEADEPILPAEASTSQEEDLSPQMQSFVHGLLEGHASLAQLHALDHKACAQTSGLETDRLVPPIAAASAAKAPHGWQQLEQPMHTAVAQARRALDGAVAGLQGVASTASLSVALAKEENTVSLLKAALESATLEGASATNKEVVMDLVRQVAESPDVTAPTFSAPEEAPAWVTDLTAGHDAVADDVSFMKEQLHDLDRKVALLTVGLAAAEKCGGRPMSGAKDPTLEEAHDLEMQVLHVLEKEVGMPSAQTEAADTTESPQEADGEVPAGGRPHARSSLAQDAEWVKALLGGDIQQHHRPSAEGAQDESESNTRAASKGDSTAAHSSAGGEDPVLRKELNVIRQELRHLREGWLAKRISTAVAEATSVMGEQLHHLDQKVVLLEMRDVEHLASDPLSDPFQEEAEQPAASDNAMAAGETSVASGSNSQDIKTLVKERVPVGGAPQLANDRHIIRRELNALRQELLELKMKSGVRAEPSPTHSKERQSVRIDTQATAELKEAIAAGGAQTPSASSVGAMTPVSRNPSLPATKERFGFVSKDQHDQLMRQVTALEKEHKKLADKVAKPRVRMSMAPSTSDVSVPDKDKEAKEEKETVSPVELETFREELWMYHQKSVQRLEAAMGNLQQGNQQVSTDVKRLRQDLNFLEERMNDEGASQPAPVVEPVAAPPPVSDTAEGDTGGDSDRVAFTRQLYEWLQTQLTELQSGLAHVRAAAGEELKGRAKKEITDFRRDTLRRFGELRQELDEGLQVMRGLRPMIPRLEELANADPAAPGPADAGPQPWEEHVQWLRTAVLDIHDQIREVQRKISIQASTSQSNLAVPLEDADLDEKLQEQRNEIRTELRSWFQDQMAKLKDSLAVEEPKSAETTGRAVQPEQGRKDSKQVEGDKRMLRQLALRVSALEDAPRIELDMISQQVVSNQRELRRQLARMQQLEQRDIASPHNRPTMSGMPSFSPKASDSDNPGKRAAGAELHAAVEDLKRELTNVMTALRGLQRDAEVQRDKLDDCAQAQASLRMRVEQGLPSLQRLLQEMIAVLSADIDSALADQLARVQGLFGTDIVQPQHGQTQSRPVTQGSLRKAEEKIRTDLLEDMANLREEVKNQLGGKADQKQLEGLHSRVQNVVAANREAAAAASVMSATDDGREPAAWRVQFGRCIVCDNKVEVGVDPNAGAPWAQKPGTTVPSQVWPAQRTLTNVPSAPQLRLNPIGSSPLPGPAPVPRRPPSPTQPRGVLPPLVPQQPMIGDKPAVSSA